MFFRKVTEDELKEAYRRGFTGEEGDVCPYWRGELIVAWHKGLKDWFNDPFSYEDALESHYRKRGMDEEDLSRLKADWEELTR